MRDALIFDGLRTPFGRHAGALAPIRPDDLLGGVIASLVARNPSAAQAIEDVVAGCANPALRGHRAQGRGQPIPILKRCPLSTGAAEAVAGAF